MLLREGHDRVAFREVEHPLRDRLCVLGLERILRGDDGELGAGDGGVVGDISGRHGLRRRALPA